MKPCQSGFGINLEEKFQVKAILLGSCALVFVSLLVTTAMAAPDGPPPGPPSAGHGDHRPPMDNPAEMADRLHDLLQLRPDQEPALQTFIAAMRPPERPEPPPEHDGKATTLERLNGMIARMEAHLAMAKQRAEATKRFYAALTPAQQRAFDAAHLDRPPHGHHGPMPGEGPHRPGDMPPPGSPMPH